MDLVSRLAELGSAQQLVLQVGQTRRGSECDVKILMALQRVRDGPSGDNAWPAQQAGYAHAPFPGRAFFAAERCIAAIGPVQQLEAIVGRIDDDGVVGDSKLVELVQEHADMLVMLQ